VTRDEISARLERDGRVFELVDTGGIEEQADGSRLGARVKTKSVAAISRADAVVYLLDGQAGISGADRGVAQQIRALGVPVLFAVNKIDRPTHEGRVLDFLELGTGEPIALSAAHGRGIAELWERIEALAAPLDEAKVDASLRDAAASKAGAGEGEEAAGAEQSGDAAGERRGRGAEEGARPAGPPRIALVGRPNVGKSSLLNRIVGFERALVDDAPGTTRDAIDVEIERGARRYQLVDTAGLRRPSRVVEKIEGHAAAASIRAIARADVVVLVLDAKIGLTDQDLRLADLVWRRGRALVVAVNKADLAEDLALERCQATIAQRLPQWPPLPAVKVSAVAGTGMKRLFAAIDAAAEAYRRQIPTPRLNAVLGAAVEAHPPPLLHGRSVKLLYGVQTRSAPAEATIFATRREGVPDSYVRYLTHALREAFGLVGVPLRVVIRERERAGREERGAPVRGGEAKGARRRSNAAPGGKGREKGSKSGPRPSAPRGRGGPQRKATTRPRGR
jgi:GTP-binding protein